MQTHLRMQYHPKRCRRLLRLENYRAHILWLTAAGCCIDRRRRDVLLLLHLCVRRRHDFYGFYDNSLLSANLSLVPHRNRRLTLLFYYFEVRKIRGVLLILCVLAVEKKQCAMPTFVFFFSQLDSIHVVINRPSMYVKIEKLMVTTTGASLA